MLLFACLTIAGGIVSWFLLTHKTVEKDRAQHYYNMFCLKLKRKGLQRHLNEGPVDFEKRLYKKCSLSQKTKTDAMFIFKAYRTLHYGNKKNSKLTTQYFKKIKSFKVCK